MSKIFRVVQRLRKLSHTLSDRRDSAAERDGARPLAVKLVDTAPVSVGRAIDEYSQTLGRSMALGSYGKYMSQDFNQYCTQIGVQCTMQMSPNDYKLLYFFKNVSPKLVKVTYYKEGVIAEEYLEPNEQTTIRMTGDQMPIIESINYR